MTLLLIFQPNLDHDTNLFACVSESISSPYIQQGSGFKRGDPTGGREAILPGITVCNQNLKGAVNKLRKYKKTKD